MESDIKKMYKKYLYGNITYDEFQEMRYAINNEPDDELSKIIEQEWNDGLFEDNLGDKEREALKSSLNFYLKCEKKYKYKRFVYRVAAVLTPVIFIGSLYLFMLNPHSRSSEFVVEVKSGDKAQITLPDHSRVWLNSKTKLTYNSDDSQQRNVKLCGEAFFKVNKDKERPFIVTMQNLHVEVLGTTFNVKAPAKSDLIETSLVEGSVKISGSDLSQTYYLKPNEKAIYSKLNKSMLIIPTDNDLETAWKDNKLKFKSEHFIDVMKKFEDWYGVTMICKCPKIQNDLTSGTFKDEKIETALNAFKIQYKIDYKIHGDTVIVTSK
jgi:transmembrane sensor